MKKIEIAKKHNVTKGFVSHLAKEIRFTSNPALAIDMSKVTGKNPLRYISPDNRKSYKPIIAKLLQM